MDESKESDSDVNIFPERQKRPRRQGEISQYFEHSKVREKSEDDDTPGGSCQRQARLSSNNGQLISKTPFTNPDTNGERQERLRHVAAETMRLLPGLLATRPDAPPVGYLCEGKMVQKLDPNYSPPGYFSTKICVINADSIDAALVLKNSSKPPVILNMANARSAGGGWKHGSLAQEECLCYRTSLSATLRYKYYPLPELSAIYSPTVLVIRESMKDGNVLLDLREPKHLDAVSIITVAAICQPPLTTGCDGSRIYADVEDKELMEAKIRIILRTAIRNKHRQIVLGAFGCGAFGNPNDVVAKMFLEILQESEFHGGWWEDIVFAVLDDGRGNYQEFRRVLDGQIV